MMKRSGSVSIIFLAVFMALLATQGLAFEIAFETGFCIRDIHISYLYRRWYIRDDCCKAATEIQEACFPKMFPHVKHPDFLPLLQQHCSHRHAPPPANGEALPHSPSPTGVEEAPLPTD
ncbi:hypothetical protein F0562_030197 [Nyssa sinensis]|uniref:Prolamin-like domain-containing protein n=1 Tax=Nyssa sinensis TaxID=561372 RepID=A0A5J5AXR4_9ASTE|nr:hypothetical protein F0562_030197 [Nyssa sinensis]